MKYLLTLFGRPSDMSSKLKGIHCPVVSIALGGILMEQSNTLMF